MKRFYLLVSLLLVLVLAVVACTSEIEVIKEVVVTPTPAPPPAPAEVVDAYVQALNTGDIAALAAVYTEDAVFSFGPLSPEGGFETLTGRAAVLADDLESIANNAQLTFSNVGVEGDTVKGEFSYTDDELQGGGVDRLTGTFEIMVEGGRIASIKPAPDEETQQKLAAAFAPPAPRDLTVLVGSGRDTVAIVGFFPSTVRIRGGDTVTWQHNSDEPHSVSFLPEGERLVAQELIPIPGRGPTDLMFNPEIVFPSKPSDTFGDTGLFNSGVMLGPAFVEALPGAPLIENFSLTFDQPGIYEYVCQVHPFAMRGTVIVEEANVADLPDQSQIDLQAQEEQAPLLADIDRIKEAGQTVRQEAGPNGTTIWHVQAGGISRDARVELMEFLAKDISIQEGDTVVWTSPSFHNVTFHPGRMHPVFLALEPQDQGPPLVTVNSEVAFPDKPAAAFDGTGFWSSGLIGIGVGPPGLLPGGSTFSMTFSKAGTFNYMCAIHRPLGMKGTITVVERKVSQVTPFSATAGEFPEGLAVDQQGNVYAGMATTGEIKKVTPQGASSTFANLPSPGGGFMLGMEFNRAGDLFVAMSSSDPETHGIWRVSRDGSSTERFAALDTAGFPNGLAFDSAGDLYVSDTTRGGIWKIDQQGNVETWSDDPILQGIIPAVSPLGISLGANGLAFHPGEQKLYVAVMEFGRIVRIPVNPDGSAGPIEVFIEVEGELYDGIAFDQAGNLYVAVLAQDRVSVISPEGEITTLAQGGSLQNPSDVRFGVGENESTLYIANFNLLRMIGLVQETPRPALHKMTISGQAGLPRIQTAPIPSTARGPAIPQDKGYLVEEIGDGLYWVTEGAYQVMFLTTGEGVIVVDAPPTIGENLLKAIAEVTDEPITHVIYSHSHADHIASAGMYPADATYIAHEETAARLAGNADRSYGFGAFLGGASVPEPTVTFTDNFTLNVGNQTLELEYRGPNHEPGNIFIYAPRQKVLMLVDVIFPGWTPFKDLAVTESTPGFVRAHDDVLSYDFDTFIGGHLTRLGTREDVETQQEYILDMQANAAQALQTVDFFAIAQQTGFENVWLLFGTYLDAVDKECAELTLQKWADRLGGVEVFTASHCFKLAESLRIN